MFENALPETRAWHNIHKSIAGSKHDFIHNLKDTESVQLRCLLKIINHNKNTEFGKRYKFSEINSIKDFVNAVPVHSYEDCRPYLESMANDKNLQILCFEKTGGSSQGCKLIPYSYDSLDLFKKALDPWFDDLLLHRPRIKSGTAYWSISPALREKQFTSGGHAIGLDNDALYFGQELAVEIGNSLAVSQQVSTLEDVDDWRFQTLVQLLLAEDLSFISVWSPTFLLELISHISDEQQKLLQVIESINPSRAASIISIFKKKSESKLTLNLLKIWPMLDTISCWTEGAAASFIPALRRLFPGVYIQGKGLLATEGVVSIPFVGVDAPVLAIESGFYEFINEDGKICLAHELEQGRIYTVLLTNESGLYRYCLGDKVSMEGFLYQAPMLKFIGRGGHSSDLCGEKLTDDFVVQVLENCGNLGDLRFLYPTLVPEPHYVLITDNVIENNVETIDRLEEELCQNPQYQYARSIGQLGKLEHRIIENCLHRYIQWNQSQGQNLGDIKPPSLVTDKGFIMELLSL